MKLNNWTNKDHIQRNAACLLCGTLVQGQVLCSACEQDIPKNQRSCNKCALPLATSAPDLICGQCQQHQPNYDSTYSFALYAPPLDRMLQQLKFHQKLYFAKLLGELMADDIQARRLTMPDLLIPVPLHTQRLRQRGYNQALELARPIASRLALPFELHHCDRHKPTCEQTGLPAHKRQFNMVGAFRVSANLRNMHVTIIDDVMTTGATVNELAKQLRKAGARRIDVWVCARAVLK